jgi:hypothetical protein
LVVVDYVFQVVARLTLTAVFLYLWLFVAMRYYGYLLLSFGVGYLLSLLFPLRVVAVVIRLLLHQPSLCHLPFVQ